MHVLTVTSISVSVLLCFIVSHITAENVVDLENEQPNSIVNEETTNGLTSAEIKQMWEKRCSRQYNVGCLKMDLVQLVDRLDGSTNFQILPGVSLVKSTPSSSNIPTDFISTNPDTFLDNYLLSKFTNYLSSLTIKVKVLDPTLINTAKSFSDGFGFNSDFNTTVTARRKNRISSSMVTAGLMSGATLLALGLSVIAAMAGKALMTSLLSLMLSAMGAIKSGGEGGHKSTTYEIVAKPIVTHAHTHSSEVQHISGHESHGSHDSGYGYARSMASTPVQPVIDEESYKQYVTDYKKYEANQLAYLAHEQPNLSTYSSVPTVSTLTSGTSSS